MEGIFIGGMLAIALVFAIKVCFELMATIDVLEASPDRSGGVDLNPIQHWAV